MIQTETLTDVQHQDDRDHHLEVAGWYRDPATYERSKRLGWSFYHLDLHGRHELLPDLCSGRCSCGAESPRLPTWQEARWWCREHRTSKGMDWQPTLPPVWELLDDPTQE
ncbi:MAG: hypothetical protein JJT89_13520 [Nitriliruptoraceae bacterium]|nr:hypothetical protein [Nitriliruptoraceae bacterium]